MALYSGPGFVLFNGVPVLQAGSITFNVETDNKDVNTLLLGRAGFSAGPKKVQASVDNAIPAIGMELDWPGIALALRLLDEVDELRAENRYLRQRLARLLED